jgi:Leucine-rich repeat (LRR) protein
MEAFTHLLGFSSQRRPNNLPSISRGSDVDETTSFSGGTINIPTFDPRPGTTENTANMVDYARSLHRHPNATASEQEVAVAVFKEAAERDHVGAMYELTVIYTERINTRSYFYQSHNQQRAAYYKDCAVARLTQDSAEFILSQQQGNEVNGVEGSVNPLSELYGACEVYLQDQAMVAKLLHNQEIVAKLPNELWNIIIPHLSQTDRRQLAATCQTLREIVRKAPPPSFISLDLSALTQSEEVGLCRYLKNLSGSGLSIKITGYRYQIQHQFDIAFGLFCETLSSNKKIKALKLDVSKCGMTNAHASNLAKLTQLSSLDISWNKIGAAGAQALALLTQLSSLDISRNNLGDAGAQALAPLTQLSWLNISANKIGAAGAQALTPLTQLSSLDISENKIGPAGAQALTPLTQLSLLNISWNVISDAGAQALTSLTQLSSLDIRKNKIGAAGAQALAPLTQLSSLNISWNEIGDAGAQALTPLTQLSSLNIIGNEIGDAGAQALTPLTQLSSLNVSGNNLGTAGAQALARLTQLSSLDISVNEMDDAGAQALARLTQLSSLDISVNKIGDAGAQALARLTQLSSLDISENRIGDAGAQALAPLTQLSSLNISGNKIGATDVQALTQALPQLTSFKR